MRGQFIRQSRLSKFFEALEIFDVAVVNLLAEEGGLAIDGRSVSDVVLTKNPRIRLGEVLGSLDFGVDLVNLLTQLSTDSVN